MASPNKQTPARRKFDQAFKAEALRMIDEGQSVLQVAKSLNVSDQLLHTWKHAHKKQTQKQAGNSELIAENDRLKAQLKRAEMEPHRRTGDILKKSIAIFTQTT
jgi:transposase